MPVAAAVFAAGGASSCHPLGRSLGWWGQRTPDASLEVRNGYDVAINVDVVSTANVGSTFAGQVGPRGRQTFRLAGVGVGTRVELRATPIDGRAVARADTVVVTRQTVWQIP